MCQWCVKKIVKRGPKEGTPSYLKGARSEGRHRFPKEQQGASMAFFVDLFWTPPLINILLTFLEYNSLKRNRT